MRIVFSIFLIFFSITNCFSQVDIFSDKYVDSVIINFKQKWKIPGISVAIAKDGRLIYAKGFGYADTINKDPVTTNSLFRTASCAKTITAIGIMKLIENNKLSLDDKVFGKDGILNGSNYTNIADSNIYRITVKNLLQQTIGWPAIDIIGSNEASYALKTHIPAGINENVKYILQQKLDFLPSTAFRYSDFNYLFLGEIISKIAQKNQVDYILSEVLHPIGVYTTIPGKSELIDRITNEVIYYDYNGEMLPSAFDTSKIVPESYSYNMEPMISSGGWISRPIDMVKIILSIDGLNYPPDILNQASINLLSSKPENINTRYAMGMYVTKSNAWFHEGECTWGTSALWFKSANNVCFAVTCNTLPTTTGSEEKKYDAMKIYAKDLIRFLPEKLESMKYYPNINLFETKEIK
jgi:CubicO group peptidase (beta-lactamase class C family)